MAMTAIVLFDLKMLFNDDITSFTLTDKACELA